MLRAQSVPRSSDTSAETTALLVDSSIHDRLEKASPLVDQTHIKLADVSYCGSVNFLLQYIWEPKIFFSSVFLIAMSMTQKHVELC